MTPPALRFADGSDTILEGLLVPFGGSFNGRDSYGTYASTRTDFALDWFEERPLLYSHGLDGAIRISPIGKMALEVRDAGVWMKAQLDSHNQYFKDIKQLVAAGALGLSSGAMAHLVEIDEKTGEWIRWPIVEGSVTPTPSNLLATIDHHTFASACRSAGLEGVSKQVEDAGVVHIEGLRATTTADVEELVRETTTGDAGSDAPISTERSFEDIRSDLLDLLNPDTLYGPDVYTSIVATYCDAVIVCRYEDDDESYWKVTYTLGSDGEPILGEAAPVTPAFISSASARSGTTPVTLDAARLTREAAALTERTKDLGERRIREGRVLSQANCRVLSQAHDALGVAHTTLATLLDATTTDAAAMARANDPAVWRGQVIELELLQLALD